MSHSLVKKPTDRTIYCRLWWAVFAYAVLASLLVQFVLLPHLFSDWHAGDGMLSGGDWYAFHRMAVDLSQEITAQGWSVWELRPEGQGPVGIAAAIYAMTMPKPWTLIPLNAALHSTAAILLMVLIKRFQHDWRLAVLSVLPFTLYPSAMIWFTQIHKDGYSIAGIYSFIYGWVLLARQETWQDGWKLPFRSAFGVLLGAGLVWIVRPYVVQMLQVVTAGLSTLLVMSFMLRGIRSQMSWKAVAIALCAIFLLVGFLSPLTQGGIEIEVPQAQLEKPSSAKSEEILAWQKTDYLPAFIEAGSNSLAIVRERYVTMFPDAKSNIDVHISFHGFQDLIAYMPRAMEIVLLAPFPNQWFEEGSIPSTTAMRRVSIIEMVGIYISLVFLPYSIWRWRRRIELWVILIICSGMMLIHGLVIANIGTLYRMRYPYIMTLVAIGVAGIIMLSEGIRLRLRIGASCIME